MRDEMFRAHHLVVEGQARVQHRLQVALVGRQGREVAMKRSQRGQVGSERVGPAIHARQRQALVEHLKQMEVRRRRATVRREGRLGRERGLY